MTARRLAMVDAQNLWMSAKIPSDEFMIYGFAGVPADLAEAVAAVLDRARACGDLRLRVRERGSLRFPEWVDGGVDDRQVRIHAVDDWAGCLQAVTALTGDQLDARISAWRLHVFPSVRGIPGVEGEGTIAVVQISHALADGVRDAALAAWLFGRDAPVTAVSVAPWESATLPVRAVRAARAHRRLMHDVDAGYVAPQADTRPVLRSNARPEGARRLRVLVRPRAELSGATVTVAVLAAISLALADHLRTLGDDPATLGAEVPMASPGPRRAHNHFGNVGVGLHPDLPHDERCARIAGELAQRRARAAHPAMLAARLASAAVPAPLVRWGASAFDPAVRSPMAIGNTVVSSVHRGAADLRFGGTPVAVTTACPTLSPMMGLTHGVHGIGDTVAVSVHGAESAVGDIDAYAARLAAALDRPT
ncbi:WS/DGAT/MGAT family O-acyltransferase [Mycolicibacterium baixiangningiae]|uniref:WS/DGAT domain-containing protein n=1 Tax=Mycolicibacterium baixiangningiae TaxID=2761578 RepID=UPI00186616F7|nr:WS/DGAT domain-containing protein [Mycolicibacterium baixiangningiae]